MNALPRGIRKRGNSFMVDVTIAGQRITRTTSTLAEAMATREALKIGNQPRDTWSLKDAFETTVARAWAGTKGEHTATVNAMAAVEFFGPDRRLDRITIEDVESFVDHLTIQGNSDATINRKLAALSKMMSVAHQRGGVAVKPHIPRKRESVGRLRWLTLEEERAAIAWADQLGLDDLADAITVLVDTGLRTGELWKLTKTDIQNGMIHVWDPKNATPRSIPMTDRVAAIMKRRTGLKPFPFDNNWMAHQWQKIRRRMNLEDDPQFVPHALRHTCASRLVQRGVPLPVVQAWLGHKSITMTLRYAHLAPANLMAAKEALENG